MAGKGKIGSSNVKGKAGAAKSCATKTAGGKVGGGTGMKATKRGK